jgi:hypothetical protein
MKRNEIRFGWLTAFILALSLLSFGCGGGGGDDEEEENEADFTEAIPNGDVIGVELDEEGGGQGLTLAEQAQAAEGQASRFAEHAGKTAERINDARQIVQTLVDAVVDATPSIEEIEGRKCRVFEGDKDGNRLVLTSCAVNRVARNFAFKLEGRAAEGSDDDLKILMAGQAKILVPNAGKRRGVGRVGFNLDAINELTGNGPTGQVAIGYRAAGRFRQVVAGFRDFQGDDDAQEFSALYNFKSIKGKGGTLKFIFNADVVSIDGGMLSEDLDGVAEVGRVSLAFSRNGKARIAGVVCGGSLGEECIFGRECAEANGTLTFTSFAQDEGDQLEFDSAKCPVKGDGADDVPLVEDEPPSEGDVEPDDGDNDGDIPGPAVDAPSEDSDLEEE